MNKNFQNVYRRFKQLVNIGTVTAVALLISFLYPNNVKFKYEFHRGQAWPYEDLMAPFDFAIVKSSQELEKDRTLIMKEFWPYYSLNSDLSSAKVKDFEAALGNWKNTTTSNQNLKISFEKIRDEGQKLLENI